ncbi:MAG TPA: sensor histidine kinase [Leptolyngbyaceae cyanobacterium M33_DOE_097]|nr:sensor histidine kinase [Leptolyngbyaceae cyanobacterium M33_DOE_097]
MFQTNSDRSVTETELDRSLGNLLQTMAEQLHSSSAALWLLCTSSNAFRPRLVYLNGDVIPVVPQTISFLEAQWLRGRSIPYDLSFEDHLCDRTPVIYNLEQRSSGANVQYQLMHHLGFETLLSVPLLLNLNTIGSFTICFTQPREFEAQELALVQALAQQAILGIQLLNQVDDVKQAAIYEERNRLAGEIHDTLAQTFTGISVQLSLAQWLIQHHPEAVTPILSRVKELSQLGLIEAHRAVWSLYPTSETYTDFTQKLSQFIEQWTCDTLLETSLRILGTPFVVSSVIGHNLLKIGQEAISNTLKHAHASKLLVIVTYGSETVSLCVRDNGQGFSIGFDNGGFGLIGIARRVELIGGQLSIHSQLKQGTEIRVEVPIQRDEDTKREKAREGVSSIR